MNFFSEKSYKENLSMKLPLKIFIHTIFWFVFLLFTVLLSMVPLIGGLSASNNLIPHLIINFLWAASIFYLFYFYFIHFFEKRQLTKYLGFSIVSSILITLLFMPMHKLIYPKFDFFNYIFFIPPMAGSFILAQCGCLVRGFENWFTNIRQKAELENRSLRNELEMLKSQINPHFLFNSLNNIDSLIHTFPDNASDSLITLSDMLRYMIYETRTDMVSLNKEIVYIKNYICLQQLRFQDPQYINITFPNLCEDIRIAPLLLIPFIENAFKYSFNAGNLPVIEISLCCKHDLLQFFCQNYYKNEKSQHERPGGVGLGNAKRRLELLYPRKHNINIVDENNIFKVELAIQLA
jgi:two-component system, LytTR family, sensor kinase